MEEFLLDLPTKETVWVLVIEHRHGFNHYVNKTKEGMLNTLADYAREWWEEDWMSRIPEDRQDIIDGYFDDNDTEWYTYDEVEVKD